jgi:hypothetical protein
MTLHEFNCKVNLPEYCKSLGRKDLLFNKLPGFGWYAYNHDLTEIGHAFDLTPADDRKNLYSKVCENPSLQEFSLIYSGYCDEVLKNNLREIGAWTIFYKRCVAALQEPLIFQDRETSTEQIFKELGFPHLLDAKVGVLTSKLKKAHAGLLDFPGFKNCINIVIPSFYTPNHLASLEVAPLENLNQRYLLWGNPQPGWYGDINSELIVGSPDLLKFHKGFTWNALCDFWTSRPCNFHEDLPDDERVQIWCSARRTLIDSPAIEQILREDKRSLIETNASKLTYSQVLELKEKYGIDVARAWRRSKERQIQFGAHNYIREDNRYYTFRRGVKLEVANFAMDLTGSFKREGIWYRKGFILYENKVVPFEMEEDHFQSNYLFKKAVRRLFVEHGIGVARVHPAFDRMFVELVEAFNEFNLASSGET